MSSTVWWTVGTIVAALILWFWPFRVSLTFFGKDDTGIRVFRDGNGWCATFDDYINLQESPAGFSGTEIGAVIDLYQDRDQSSELEMMEKLTHESSDSDRNSRTV
jgi:hypothetical protein